MVQKIKRQRAAGSLNKEFKLETGETLLIWRRRRDWNQSQAADYFGVSVFTYKLAEYGKISLKKKITAITDILPYERCLIYRKRATLTQQALAKQLGVGRYWLRLQEAGRVNCEKLLAHWEK